MTENNHTPEPWHIKCHTCETPADIDGGDDYTIIGADGTQVAFEPCKFDPNKGADARRIVACVNACAGIPTAWIEGGPIDILEYSMALKKQRDDLLASLEKVTAKLAWLNSDDCGHIMALTDEAEALIASVKGGAA